MTNRKKIDLNPLNSIGSILVMVVGFILLWYLIKGFFAIQPFVALALLGITAIINYKVILGYVKFLANLLRTNTVAGILGVLLTIIFPLIVTLFLFGKAMLHRKVGKLTQEYEAKQKGEFVEFEEVQDESTLIELPPQNLNKQKNSEYEELFDDEAEQEKG